MAAARPRALAAWFPPVGPDGCPACRAHRARALAPFIRGLRRCPSPHRGRAPLRESVAPGVCLGVACGPPPPRFLLGPPGLVRRFGAGLRGRPASGAGGFLFGLAPGAPGLIGLAGLVRLCGPSGRRPASREPRRLCSRSGLSGLLVCRAGPGSASCAAGAGPRSRCSLFAGPPGRAAAPLFRCGGGGSPRQPPTLSYTYFRLAAATPRGALRREIEGGLQKSKKNAPFV